MDIDALLKQIQDWTNRVPLVVLGSGASIPYNLPSMWTLGEHLKNSISFVAKEDQKQFERFKTLFDKNGDLEATLSQIQLREKVLNQIVLKTWELVNSRDLDAYSKFIEGTFEFPLYKLIEHLLSSSNRKLSIVTTNYDRLAEYAASYSRAIICTGYSQNYIGHFSNAIHQNSLTAIKGYSGQVNIWKVHGSLDWFKTNNEDNIQLPLRHFVPDNYKPSIVTPGLTKYFETHNEPYRTIFAQADHEIDTANGFLCIGYGFNDIHVQPKLIEKIKSTPIIVITKELTNKTKQAILNGKCKQYILMEEAGKTGTRIYSSSFGEHTIDNVNYWSLSEYLKLIIT